jgi:hypothetical protein
VLNTPYTEWEGDQVHGQHRKIKPVWVRLDAICGRLPGQPHHVVPDGLDMTGEVPGRLHGWFSSALGDWLAIVDFEVPYADGRRTKVELVDQLVPAWALRRRDEPGQAGADPTS